MDEIKPNYLAFLLRMWPIEEKYLSEFASKTIWRVSLENAYTHAHYGFASLKLAFAFLHQQTIVKKEENDEME